VVQFCWIPENYISDGNGIADRLKKIFGIRIHIPLGKGDTKALNKSQIIQRWQDEWELENNARHYHRNQNCVGGKRITSLGLNRHEEFKV